MAIPISGTLEPAGKFPLVEASSVYVSDDKQLDVYLTERENELNGLMNTALTQMASMMATDQALAKADAELAKADEALAKADEALAKRTKAVEDTLAEFSVSYPIETSGTALQPETYYVFGSVDSLSVTLVDPNDGKVHEYCFEFKPSASFKEESLSITPKPNWANQLQFAEGKTCQVSIMRGIGVMVCA
jgi:hypothetical protein